MSWFFSSKKSENKESNKLIYEQENNFGKLVDDDSEDEKENIELTNLQSNKVLSKGELKYEGSTNAGKKNGFGTIYKNNFKIYEGNWINDYYEGNGKEFNDSGLLIKEGLFANGVLITGIEYVLRNNGVTVKKIKNCYETKIYNVYGDQFLDIIDIIMQQIK